MGFISNFAFRLILFSSILIFITKIYFERVFESKEYIDGLNFFLNKISLNKDLKSKIEICIHEHLEKIILFTGFSCILSILEVKIFSYITSILYGVLAITNFIISKEIFRFDFNHLTQEFLIIIAPLILIPISELNLILSQNDLTKKLVECNK